MAPLPPSCLLLPLDGCFVLCSTITLALLLFLSRRTPGGLFVWDKSLLWGARKGILPLPMESESTMNLPSWTQRDHDQESRGQSHEAVLDKEEGTTVQEQEPQCSQSAWKGSGHTATTIRKLLCDNATCVLCERAAREAEKVVHIQRLSPENLVLRKPSLPTTSYVERSSLPSISALQDNPIFSRSRSEPPPSSGHLRHSLGASPLLGKRERPPQNAAQRKRPLPSTSPGADIFPKHIRHLRHPHSQVASKGKDHFCTIDEQKDKEDESSTSSSMSNLPRTNRAEYGHSSGVSKGSQKNHTLRGHQKTFHHHEDKDERSSSSERDASPNSQGEDHRGTHFVSEPEQDFPISPLTSSGTRSSRKMAFVPTDIPFVSETVLETLERHLVVKRVQNTMGLPVVLLRSLKAFLPFAPSSNIQRPLKREVVVVTRPQVLPFKSVAIRRRLEQHVKKRAHLKYWGLPRQLQAVIRHMKVDFHPTVPWEEGSGRGKPQRAVKPHHLIPRSAPTARDTAFNPPLHFKPRFQVHIGKKLFQIAQETFPKRVENSQKTAALEEKKIVLPKLIRLHWRHPQLRGGPSLGLRRKADCVEMNIKYKRIQFLWDLPTLYSQSLSKIAPEAFHLPVAPPQVPPRSEFVHAETPFLPTSQRQCLDLHVLRKRVQHQWGQPGLVQQSLWQFLSAAPPAATFNPATTKCHRVDIKVAPTSAKSLIPLETSRKLDGHIRRKIIERQWGIPQRVMRSLQTYMPMSPTVAKTARESEKEKVQKRSPSVKEPSLCKFPQALQRHVAKKALEIHLGPAGPFSTLLQTGALRERRDALPRIISPESGTLQLRPKELHFVELAALDRIELSIRHKDLAHRWGLPTWYKKSLSYLFTGVEFKGPPPPVSRKGIVLDFSSSDTLFISQGTQKDLEWHVRRKRMQHTWGLAGLVQKSLQLLMPDAPHLHTAGHTEVTTLPAKVTFSGDAKAIHELERNVLKRVVLQRWHLPRRVLAPVKLPGSETAAVSGPRQEKRKPRRTAVSSPHQPEVFHMPQGKALKEVEFHLDKKHMEILLGVVPAMVRFSWRCAFFTQRQPLPKLIPPGRSFLQPRRHLLPFERPEDVAQIEQTLRHKNLMFLWGPSTQFLEALGGMTPKPSLQPLRPRWAGRLAFSEGKVLFLREQDQGAFEGHIRRKRLQHQWGLPDVVQRSLRGFVGGAPSQRSHRNTVIHVQVLHKELSFLPWGSGHYLELHIRRRKQQRQWGLPRRVLEALRVLGAESIAGPQAKQMEGVDQGQLGLEPSGLQSEAVATSGEEGPASQPLSPRATSPPEALCFRSEAEKKIQLLFLKKCVEVLTGVFPGVARQSWQRLPPSRAPLLKPVSPGSRVPQPRRRFLPFAQAEDIGRLELAILRHRLASFWGLGRVYVEGIAALRPKLPSNHVRPREGEAELSEDRAVSLPAQVREALELHVRKKRLEHEWGFPGLIWKSLRGFMQRAPPPPSLQKGERYARILCWSPAFLSRSTCTHLESHIRRRQLQQRWRLPAKALRSVKLLYPQLESGPSDPRSNGDEEVPFYCFGHGAVSEHPTVDLAHLQPGGGMETAGSGGATPQRAQVLSTVDHKDMDRLQLLLTKKNMEVQLEAIPNIAGLAGTQSSSRQHLPKLIPPSFEIQQHRTSFLPFFRAGETEQIEMAIRCNHLASLWGLGTRHVDVLSAMHFNPLSEHFRLRRTGIEFSEAQTLFLREQERQDLESHVAKKKIQHTWGSPVLVQKSAKAFMQGLPVAPTPQRSAICVHIIHQAPSFLPRDISSRFEFHIQKMNFQRQWGLPRRVLKSLWLLCPAGEDADVQRPMAPMSHLDQAWRNFPRDPSSGTAPGGWPAGAQSTEQDLRQKSEVRSALEPQSLRRLQLHLAKKYMEVQHGGLPTIAKASLQLADLYSKQPLSKWICSGHGLLRPRNISLLTVPTEDWGHLEWTVQRNDFDFLWGPGPRYKEALAEVMPEFAFPFSRHRRANKDFLEMQTFFLQKKDREALEEHMKKKRIQHIWSCPILVQRSMECFMPRAPLCPSTQKVETNIRVTLHELHFLPPNTQTHLEHHIQKRKLLQQWGLPKQMLSSLKIFLPAASEMQAPLSPTKKFWEEPKNQEWKQMFETFSSKQESALQSHLKRKHLEMHLGVDPRLVKLSRDKAHGLEREHLPILIHPGQKCPTGRTQSLLYLPPNTLSTLELNVKRKYLTFLWGLPSQYLESLSRMTSAVPISNPPKQQIFRFQGVETPFLQGKEKEALEHHVKKKRLQHQWRLPAAVQRSLHTFAPSLLVPIHPPKRVGQDMKIQVQRPLFLPPHSQENLEDSLKRMIIHQKWGLPRRIHDSLRAFSPALPVRTQQPHQKKAGPDLNYYSAKTSNLKSHLGRKSTEITLQSRMVSNILLTESLYGERDPRSTTQPPAAPSAVAGKGPKPITSRDEALGLLEFHILHKKICHEWGLPLLVQKSLSAFCPPLPEPQADRGTVGGSLELGKEDGATVGEKSSQDAEVKLLGEDPQVTKEEVSESPRESERDSVSTKATEVDRLKATGGMPQPSKETSSTGGKLQGSKEESQEPSQGTEKGRSASKTLQPLTKTSADPESPQARAKSTTSPPSPQAPEEVRRERPETVEADSPETSKRATVPSRSPQAAGAANVAGLQIAELVAGETPKGSSAPVPGGSPETSRMGQSPQVREEKSIVPRETTNGSCPEEQEEEPSALGKSSEAVSKEGPPLEGLSRTEEGNAERGPLLAGAEGGLPEQHPEGAAATERPPEEGGVQDAGGSCQVTGGRSTLAEGPEAAERKGMVGKSLARDRTDRPATPLGGHAPEQTQESFRTFLPHLESRFHSYYKPTRVHFLVETEPKSHSSPPRKSPVCRAELCLQLERGGRIGSSWVSTEKPSCSFSAEALPAVEASEGGSGQETEPETSKARLCGRRGGSPRDELELEWGPQLPLQQDTPERGLRTLHDPEGYGSQSLLLPQSSYDEDDAGGRRDSQASDSSEFSSLESNAESMPSGALEQLPWDKDRFSRQLERSIQGMVRHSAPPSGLRRSVMKHVTYSPYECGTTVCERDVGQRCEQQGELAFSMANDAGTRSMASLEDNETQNKIHCAGSIGQGYLPGQENLLKPSEVAANPRLRSHITQRALGSFILPTCVISSYSSYEDVEVGLIRQAGREHRQKLSAQLLEEKPILEEERESPPEQGHSVAGDAGRPLMSAALYTGEPRDWADRYKCEPSQPPPSLNVSRTSMEQQDHEGSQITEEAGEASRAGSEVSGVSSKKFSTVSSLEAGSELPAPPSDWLRSGTEDEGAERECEDSSSLVIEDVPQTPHHCPTQQYPLSVEDQSQFSTECEWERVGDWDSEGIGGWDSESLTKEEESSDLGLEERPTEGSSLPAGARSQLQAKRASSSSGTEKSKGLSLIGSIVERKLSLKQGLNIWQRSQGRWPTTWTEKNGHGVPSGEEEATEAAEGRAGFSGDARCALGDVAERWVDTHSAGQSEEEARRQGGAHVPPTQAFLAGFHNRSDASTSSASTGCQADRSSSENYIKERTEGPEEEELAWDGSGNKTSGLASVARRRRNPKPGSPERPAERGAGGRLWGSSQGKIRPGWRDRDSSSREESSSGGREERPSGGTPGREGRPATLGQGAARIRGWRSGRRRKGSLPHGRPGNPPLGAGQPAAGRSPRSRGRSSERGALRRRPQDCRAAGREGSPLEDGRGPPGGCGAYETRAPLGRPGGPLPEGEQFRSLRERILLRRKELWSSPDSGEENPA